MADAEPERHPRDELDDPRTIRLVSLILFLALIALLIAFVILPALSELARSLN